MHHPASGSDVAQYELRLADDLIAAETRRQEYSLALLQVDAARRSCELHAPLEASEAVERLVTSMAFATCSSRGLPSLPTRP